jgi:hypothetical protein
VNFGDPRVAESVWDRLHPCPMSGCWLWSGKTDSKGHALLIVDKQHRRVHRHVYAAAFGEHLVDGRHIEPACGVRGCCNPLHFYQMSADELHRRRMASQQARRNRIRRGADGRRRERNAHLRHRFGIGVDDEERMLAAQHGSCAICRSDITARRHVDHDHTTGAVRALLCHFCNLGLGQFRDSPERLESAAAYLRLHSSADDA